MHEEVLQYMCRAQHTWNNDGAGGIEVSHTSEHIWLECLMVPGNYSMHWHGKDNTGAKQKQIGQLIANSMNNAKAKVHHNGKLVMNKIHNFEEQFCRAHDWTNTETEASLQASDTGTFEDAIHKICHIF